PMAPLPPQIARNKGRTAEEILKELNSSPLFMTELEEDNEQLQALEALAYEGSPMENATDFKRSGNEAFGEKRWADAVEFYGRGVSIMLQEEARRKKGTPPPEQYPQGNDEDEVERQRAMIGTLYSNRAACHLELKNYRSCYLDCRNALQYNDRNLKAWYRSARALLAAGRIEEADDACAGGLSVDRDNGPLQEIEKEITAKKEALAKKLAEEQRRKAEAAAHEMTLARVLRERNITVRKSARPPEMGDARVQVIEAGEAGGEQGRQGELVLTFPTVLLYPLHYESDFIKAFSERETLMQHFGYVFPLPWDREGEYKAGGVECFIETVTGGLMRVGKKVELRSALATDSVEVVDGVVRIYVVPKPKAEGWVKEFKATK
ncbi:hypothetical protein M406DRAFT_25944, partial [Cryphonectria parasitica EP155]